MTTQEPNHLTMLCETYTTEQRRILYETIREIKKKKLSGNTNPIIDIQIKNVLTTNSKDYTGVRESTLEMTQKHVTLTSIKGFRYQSPLFAKVDTESERGTITICFNPTIYQTMVRLSKSYSYYNISLLKQLETTAAMKLYEITALTSSPLTFGIPFLKNILGMNNKYPNNGTFIKNVIEASQKYIKQHSSKSFNYKIIKEDRKIIAITLYPIRHRSTFLDETFDSF